MQVAAALTKLRQSGTDHVQVDAVAAAVAKSPIALTCMAEWVRSDDEWVGRGGWAVMARLANDQPEVPDAAFIPYLTMIERGIASAKNRAREGMHQALIAIGSRSDELAAIATAVAGRIGPVAIEQGETEVKTPDASDHIARARIHRARFSRDRRATVAEAPRPKAKKTAARTAAKQAAKQAAKAPARTVAKKPAKKPRAATTRRTSARR